MLFFKLLEDMVRHFASGVTNVVPSAEQTLPAFGHSVWSVRSQVIAVRLQLGFARYDFFACHTSGFRSV